MRPVSAWYPTEDSLVIEAGGPRVALYECDGIVHSPRSFALSRLHLLSGTEADILRNGLEVLPDEVHDFRGVKCCLTRSS